MILTVQYEPNIHEILFHFMTMKIESNYSPSSSNPGKVDDNITVLIVC